jgi:hypothetical protein
MYPVISILRRAAGPVIYVRPSQLSIVGGSATVNLSVSSPYADLSAAKWGKPSKSVPLFQLRTSAKSSEAVAVALAAKENELAKALSLTDRMYTLVVGEETESVEGDVFTRTFRVGIIKGIFGRTDSSNSISRIAASNPEALFTDELKSKRKGRKRRLPAGVILENR